MSKSPRSPQTEAESLYTKATKAELAREYDTAFSLYINAAEAFLHLSRSSGERDKAKVIWSTKAKKAMDRADKVKEFVERSKSGIGTKGSGDTITDTTEKTAKLSLTPVSINPFSQREQLFILKRGALVNGLKYSLWDEPLGPFDWNSELPLYTDDDQPTLSHEQQKVNAVWRRPKTVAVDAVEYSRDAYQDIWPQDIIQHVVTDCSVCASISVCIEHNRRFGSNLANSAICRPRVALRRHSLVSKATTWDQPIRGRYDLKLFFNGAWRRVSIDDQLLYHPALGTLMCMSTVSRQSDSVNDTVLPVLWPSFLEKGYMKLMGGYDFPGSNSSADIHVITGWIPEHMEIKSPHFEREKTWERIKCGFINGQCLLTLGTGPRDYLSWRGIRLLPSHSYAVTDIQEMEDERVLTVLDSWLPMADTGPEPHPARILAIPWSDVLDVFDGIYLSWDTKMFAQSLVIHGMWNRKGDEEQSNSCHLLLKFDSVARIADNEIWVLLSRHVYDSRQSSQYISLNVQLEDELATQGNGFVDLSKVSVRGTYTNSNHVLLRMRIPVSQRTGTLSVFALYEGGLSEVGFTVTVYASSDFNLSWIQNTESFLYKTKIDGTLTVKNAGGNSTYPSFLINPQYHLRIHNNMSSPTATWSRDKAAVVLSARSSKNVPINITVVHSQGNRVFELTENKVAATSGPYAFGLARLSKHLPLGDYTVIVSAFEPHFVGSYSLKVECSHRFSLDAILQEGAGMYQKVVRSAWDERTAAGGPGFNKYSQNPTFEFETSSPTELIIRLQLRRPGTCIPINVTLYLASEDGSLSRHLATSGAYNDAVSGVSIPQTSVPAGKYWIIPSTYNAGVKALFTLTIYSSSADVTLVQRAVQ